MTVHAIVKRKSPAKKAVAPSRLSKIEQLFKNWYFPNMSSTLYEVSSLPTNTNIKRRCKKQIATIRLHFTITKPSPIATPKQADTIAPSSVPGGIQHTTLGACM